MKDVMSLLGLLLFSVVLLSFTVAEKKPKKVQTFQVSKVLPFSAQEVWKVVGEDYGKIAHSHPAIVYSEYIDGSLKGGEGAERVCNFNESGTRYLKEKMVNYDPQNFRFTNQVFQAGKFPVDPDLTRAVYSVTPISNTTCRLTFDMQYRTKPAFMGGMMKGNFKNLINDYFISIEHHIKTGETVTKENFKSIKKQYKTS